MKKRVGITHDPEERKKYWKREYPSLWNWEIVSSGLTYEEAQRIEKDYIDNKGYEGGLGGERKSGRIYSVYTFNHD